MRVPGGLREQLIEKKMFSWGCIKIKNVNLQTSFRIFM
jgi:hypothetical protein